MRILAIITTLAISGCATQDYQQYASTVPGQVLSVSSGTARIATSAGAVLASVQGTLKPGDRCSITAGIARKTPPSSQTYAL